MGKTKRVRLKERRAAKKAADEAWLESIRESDAFDYGRLKGAGIVYAIKCCDSVKIGQTGYRCAASRLKELRLMCPHPLEVIAEIEVPDRRGLEKQIHKHFAAFRQHGEWFAIPTDKMPELFAFYERNPAPSASVVPFIAAA